VRLVYICLQATRQGQASYAHVHEIIRGLERRGWRVQLFQPSYVNSTREPGSLRRLIEVAWLQIRALPAILRADVVYVRAHFAALPASTLAGLRRVPVVQELNGPYDDMFIAWPQLKRARRLVVGAQRIQLRRASEVIAVTDGLAEWVRRDARPRRIAVVPNGANTDLFSPSGPRRGGMPERYAGFVGALSGWQGTEIMLRAVDDPEWPADHALVVAGDGAGAEAVRRAASRNSRVVHLGRLPYREIPAVIRGATVMLSVQPLIPRTAAGGINPLKVYEALACAVPVVVSDLPGQADLVRHERCGWVVPPGDAAAVARAVALAAANPEETAAAGARGREALVREHSWEARAADTHAVLVKLLEEHRP